MLGMILYIATYALFDKGIYITVLTLSPAAWP